MKARNFAVAVALSVGLSGCACIGHHTTWLGHLNDYPSDIDEQYTSAPVPNQQTIYQSVREWAADAEDTYYSRALFNRNALDVGGALAAAGVGAVSGLATAGYAGNAMYIIPLSGAFLATIAGIAQNDEKAELYAAAAASIKVLLRKSDDRLATKINSVGDTGVVDIAEPPYLDEKGDYKFHPEQIPKLCSLKRLSDNTKLDDRKHAVACEQAKTELDLYNQLVEKTKTAADLQHIGNGDKSTTPSSSTISGFISAIGNLDTQIKSDEARIKQLDAVLKNIDALRTNDMHQFEASCLRQDIDNVMAIVTTNLDLLEPSTSSVGKALSTTKGNPPAGTSPVGAPAAGSTGTGSQNGFDISKLDPSKITSVCEIESGN